MNSDTEDDDGSSVIYTSRLGSSSITPSTSSSGHLNVGGNSLGHTYTRASSSQSLRSRIFSLASSTSSPRVRDKPICTTPGVLCAGETETETDEPSRALPTARIIPPSLPLIPPSTLEQRLTPLLFEFARLLSIVPAVFGTLYNIYFIIWPPKPTGVGRPPPERIDYFISALWAILTGYQCLALATGLLTRWRLYYPPLSTLVRLLALQGICWPATHLTLTMLGHEVRPIVTWAAIGTTTCCSRSIQIWVTSNLWWERRGAGEDSNASVPLGDTATSTMADGSSASTVSHTPLHKPPAPAPRQTYWKRWGGGGKWGGRRWDWREVGVKCALPAGVVYFIMAWAEQLRRELAVGGGLNLSSTYNEAGIAR
ncbi:hypothetical protein JR316_0012445 [Psilocybe cubensis]|uniref:Uncharacterized protein n=2 Tax=Psilocybe cubensis TaxID=181762 RepID=A0A8H7XR71_PSICU|nr:hypothetical protein JR316_0012445 [Psilocybe cubensis]KAH9475334.1 hypothetical protein JR316_0012445 [Psilocybe cubensis]